MAKRPAPQKTHPITLAELARRAGVNRSSITRLAQGALRAAILADSRIDAAHDSVAAWARGRGIKPQLLTAGVGEAPAGARRRTDEPAASPQPKRARPARAPTLERDPDDSDDDEPTGFEVSTDLDAATIVNVMEMTLGQVRERYRTDTRFVDVLKAVKLAEEIRYKFLDNEEQEGRLVPREAVEKFMFGGFDELFRRLLGDMPKTLTSQVAAYAQSGEPEKGEAFVRDLLGTQIQSAKERMVERVQAL